VYPIQHVLHAPCSSLGIRVPCSVQVSTGCKFLFLCSNELMMMTPGCLQVQWYESAVSSRVKDEAQVERSTSVPCLPSWCSGLLAFSCSRDERPVTSGLAR